MIMAKQFLVWEPKRVPNASTLKDFEGFDLSHELRKGVPHAHDFPSTAQIHMDPETPTATVIPDNAKNTNNMIIISSKLKSFLEEQGLVDVEYLPITVMDHKNRPVEAEYFIFTPINNIDCLDIDACEPRWSAIDDTILKKVKQFVLIDDKIPDTKRYFRPKFYTGRPLIEAGLAQSILDAGFTGVQFLPLSEISGRIE
jgi:hypothetical protein